ncbi:hypothetical protein SVIOM342S_02045 [Streptomyces violaceorubidus]
MGAPAHLRVYDRELRPAHLKAGVLFGMGMTEKQGGSDIRANTTSARPLSEDGAYELTGHKWFCSAPMSDGFLVLARAPGGLTCFLVPRVLADGTRNVFLIQRLEDELGDRCQRLGRGRVRRDLGAPGRRGGAWVPRSSTWWRRPGWTACWARRA